MAGLLGSGLLGQLGPIAKMLGLDKVANKLARDKVAPLLVQAIPKVAKRLEADGITPALKATDAAGERFFIRAAMYLLAKEALSQVLPKGANLAADFLRDAHDDAVVAVVSAELTNTTPLLDAVALVKREFMERIF